MTKTPEEKPYLQDLFNHMRTEHDLILTQSEMQEIISVVQQSLTTETVVKENFTSEEKAREKPNLYAILEKMDFEDRCKRVHSFAVRSNSDYVTTQGIFGVVQEVFEKVDDAYHSRDEEVKELREALEEIANSLQERCDKYGMSPIEHEALAKAKQLINKK